MSAVVLLLSHPALADCVPAIPTSGQTVTCTGNPSGFSSSGLGALTVNIVSDTNFNGPLVISNTGTLGVTSAGRLGSVTLINDDFITFVNSRSINQGLVIVGNGTYSVTNNDNAFINQTFSFTGNSNNTITNFGFLNDGVTVNGDGTTTIVNNANAFINNGIFINGASQTLVNNYGVIQSNTLLGTGNDTINNYDPGTINGTVDQRAGNDLFRMYGGRVNTSIIQSAGTDRFELYGGEVTSSLLAGTGNDTMLWTGGLIGGVDMGDDNDLALFQGLTDTQLRTIRIDGGQGNDALAWDNTQGSNPNRIINWELFALTNGSKLTMNNNLVLGDTGTGTGALAIDATSVLNGSGVQSTISPAVGGRFVSVSNAGVIDLSTGSNSTTDSLRIVGNYLGNSGQLWLQSTLGNDSSPADKLMIEAGKASGSTGIRVTNVGGAGDETVQGILVVQALNGATTNDDAFHLSQRVSAGPYEYLLVKGQSAGTQQNWYLRNTFDPVSPEEPGPLPPDLFPGCDEDCESGGSGGYFEPGPAIRPEVPLLTLVPGMARAVIRDTMGTFHDRHGEQAWMADEQSGHAMWTRVFGGSYDRDLPTLLDAQYDGHTSGFQAGLPIYEHEGKTVLDTFGLFAGYSRGWGDVNAEALNRHTINVGDIAINAYSLAAYWTRTSTGGSYIDAVLMHSWLNPTTNSIGDYHSNFYGSAVTGSLETGTPLALSDHWNLEPQGQIIWQYQHYDTTYDPGGSISYDDSNSFTGRVGMRLQGNYLYDEKKVSPFALANLWHGFSTTDVTSFDGFPFNTPRESTTLELGAGVTADLSANTRLYANASYAFNLGGDDLKAVAGHIGLRVRW